MTSKLNGYRENLPYNKHAANVYSQNGEDGILAQLIKDLGIDTKHMECVEFGAWDGIKYSNTYKLVTENPDARFLYIEGDEKKFQDLVNTALNHYNIDGICSYVYRDNICELLRDNNIDKHFDLISIDIDSHDLDVMEAMLEGGYRPEIIVVEIKSSIPPGKISRHKDDGNLNTFSATVEVAQKHGYGLVCHCGNLIFAYDAKGLIEPKYLDKPELLFIDHWLPKTN